MKVALLLPANLCYSPYANIYTRILDAHQIAYDVIAWNRKGVQENVAFAYDRRLSETQSAASHAIAYFNYARFVQSCVRQERYDKLIVFSAQLGIFLAPFLRRYFRGRYVLDYRDVSIEQRVMPLYRMALAHSSLNVISSPGYRRCLPADATYVISHNIDTDLLHRRDEVRSPRPVVMTDGIEILTIGFIRNYAKNLELVNALADLPDFRLRFVGQGPAAGALAKTVEERRINNVSFVGFYDKEQEASYFDACTMVNIVWPIGTSKDMALSNRFYNALLCQKPMIVTKNTIQGDLVERYDLGVAVDSCVDLPMVLRRYLTDFDATRYATGRDQLLSAIVAEQHQFETALVDVLRR